MSVLPTLIYNTILIEFAELWKETLDELITNLKAEDQRMVWLKDQYLFLYYQDDLCMGPLAADAIKVL